MAARHWNLRYAIAKLKNALAEATTSSQASSMTQVIQSTMEAYQRRMTQVLPLAGVSMAPTLNPAGAKDPSAVERLLIRDIPRPSPDTVFVGDVVTLHNPMAMATIAGGTGSLDVMVRRVAAMEGDQLVTDDPEDEPYTLRKGECWVLADNEELSPPDVIDSRVFGPLDLRSILGRHHAVAGCSAGIVSVLALQPLDVIKTRLQVQDGVKGQLPQYRGTWDATRVIIKQEGLAALYAGLAPAVLGAGVAWGVYFFAYNRAKQRYMRMSRSGDRLPAHLHLLSAVEAGSLVCFVTNPLWVAKTRLQLQQRTVMAASMAGKASGAPYKGLLDCLVQIARHEGLPGLYKGLVPSLLLVSHGAIQFAVYEELKTLFNTQWQHDRLFGGRGPAQPTARRVRPSAMEAATPLSPLEAMACGALSKIVASVATYPSQVIRARLQQRVDAARAVQYRGVAHTIRQTFRREGLPGFYRGLVPNVLRVVPQSAITFVVYESVMKWLQPPPLEPAGQSRR